MPYKKHNNIILTGIPRSGTTLVCYLLNAVPDVVALDEPIDVRPVFDMPDHGEICKRVARCFLDMRRSIQIHKTAISKHVEGRVVDNHATYYDEQSGGRKFGGSKGEIVIAKALGPDFFLLLKHAFQFTALAETLVRAFPVFATIRNPLPVLASWNSVAFPVRRGKNPWAKTLAPELAKNLDSIKDRIERQLYYLSWYYEKYLTVLPKNAVVRYENLIASGGQALKTIIPEAERLNEPLENKNLNPIYHHDVVLTLADRLLKTDGYFWAFYSKESVETIAARFEGRNLKS